MAKNVMTEVAKALGLELGEEFSLGDTDKYVLLDDGLFKTIGKLTYWQVGIENLLTGEWNVVKLPKPILDEAEKRYLSNIIKPFIKTIKYIIKNKKIVMVMNILVLHTMIVQVRGALNFPDFKPGAMYRGMKIARPYTLKQLGL